LNQRRDAPATAFDYPGCNRANELANTQRTFKGREIMANATIATATVSDSVVRLFARIAGRGHITGRTAHWTI
jgi:hypothetical protein